MLIKKIRIPTTDEWQKLVDVTHGNDSHMHWHKMFSWCQGKGTDAAEMLPCYPICGYDAASQCAGASVDARDTGIGFRPVFEVDGLDALPDGMLVTVGALYMDGSLVKVARNPIWAGDIQNFKPDSPLEFRDTVADPRYNVKAFKVGDVLIADRVLLNHISLVDIRENLVVPDASAYPFRFYLPIGDWSSDGHGKCVNVLVKSNVPVEQVREAHFRIKETTGIDIHSFCDGYEDEIVPDEVVEQMNALGFPFEVEEGEDACIQPEEMAALWMFLLQKADPTIRLKEDDEDIPMLPFYGNDEKGRHIDQVGYGLFWAEDLV